MDGQTDEGTNERTDKLTREIARPIYRTIISFGKKKKIADTSFKSGVAKRKAITKHSQVFQVIASSEIVIQIPNIYF